MSEFDAGDMTCAAVEAASGARCHKVAGHGGPHNGWAHYPGQLASWPTTPEPEHE